MRCASCGTANADTARFCGSCGTRLTRRCPHCGADITPGLRFCTTCGGAVPEDAAAVETGHAAREGSPDGALAAERRLVSVLFLDLVDFTALTEPLDPEDVRALQSGYFELARAVVLRYGGTLEKFIGDAVMAVWGAPTAQEDDAERAVRAALELVTGVAKVRGATSAVRLSARAAVATGEVAVSVAADGQGMVSGDLVNTAARLQAAAPADQVLVDDATRRAIGEGVDFEAAGTPLLKGKARAVRAWRAIRPADAAAVSRAAGHSGPFVGRDRELAELLDLQRRTATEGRSRLLSIIGIAGIGKIRLVWELERTLDDRPDPVALHVGRAPAYGEGTTFAPLAEMVRRRARIAEGTVSEVARRQLEATLPEFVPDAAERQWIEPRLATLLHPGSETSFERDDLFAAWRRFFERVSEWAPSLLVFEDLQWADPSLLDFIEYLAAWSGRERILILALARPDLLDRRPTWGADQPRFTGLRLERLDDESMAHLIAGLAPGIPKQAIARIVERAGGVPLYAVELIRMLIDRGVLDPRDGHVPLVGDILGEEIPESLHSLVAARIDLLPPDERTVLLSASVLGRRFHPEALAAITGLSPSVVRERTAALVRRESLALDEELRSPGRGQLSFVQDVVREVAYRTLSRRQRRTLHLAAADHLDALDQQDLSEAVAEHLVAAHASAGSDPAGGAIAERAVAALRRSAARSMTLRVPRRALELLERALALAASDDARTDLLEEAAVAARAVPRYDVAEKYLRELIERLAARGQRTRAVRARAQLASLLLATERPGTALVDLEDALEGLGDPSTDPSIVELAGQLARARMLTGDYAEALEWSDRTLAAAEELGLDAVAADARITRGTARMRSGALEEGLADLHAAIADAAEKGLISAELRARNNLAWLVVSDDPRLTLETARSGLQLATAMGVGDMALQLTEVATTVAVETGDWAWADDALAAARDVPQAPAHRIQFAATEALLHALRGDLTAAARALDELEPIASDTDPQIMAAVDAARAWIGFLDRRFEEAIVCADRAAGGSLGADRHAAVALATRARLWRGDAEGAGSWLTRLDELNEHGRAARATALTLEAGRKALLRQPDASAAYAAALEAWAPLRLPVQRALCVVERDRFVAIRNGRTEARAERDESFRELEAIGAEGILRLARS